MEQRIFIGLSLPGAVAQGLEEWLALWRSKAPQGRWEKPSNWHITLCFIGGVEPTRVANIASALREASANCQAFHLKLGELGYFSRGAMLTPWVGLEGDTKSLTQLWKGLSHLRMKEDESFRPHITLARNVSAGPFRDILDRVPSPPQLEWQVKAVQLFETRFEPTGKRYVAVASETLSARGTLL